jgi:hypothetical protein
MELLHGFGSRRTVLRQISTAGRTILPGPRPSINVDAFSSFEPLGPSPFYELCGALVTIDNEKVSFLLTSSPVNFGTALMIARE